MYSSYLSALSLAAGFLFSPSHAAWDPNRPFVFGSTEGALQEADLPRELPLHTKSSSAYTAGWIPKYCYNEARTYNLDPADFEVRNVIYNDCAAPWVICRYKTASTSWNTVIDLVGRVPVGARQYISNLLILPNSVTNKCAYTWGGEFQSSSYVPGCFTLGVVAHETSHILDGAALADVIAADGLPAGTAYSSTNHWSGAYNKDTAVITAYARSSWSESFADTGRFAWSHMVHPGGLGAYNSQWTKVSNQVGNYVGRLRPIIFPSSGTCTGKVPSTVPVRVSNGSTSKRWSRDAPRSELDGTGVPEIAKPENVTAEQFVYNGIAPTLL